MCIKCLEFPVRKPTKRKERKALYSYDLINMHTSNNKLFIREFAPDS